MRLLSNRNQLGATASKPVSAFTLLQPISIHEQTSENCFHSGWKAPQSWWEGKRLEMTPLSSISRFLQGLGRVPLRACWWPFGLLLGSRRWNLGGSSSGLGSGVCMGSRTSSEMELLHEHLWHFMGIFHCCLNPRSHDWWPVHGVDVCLSVCARVWRGKEAEWERLLSGEISRNVHAEDQVRVKNHLWGVYCTPGTLWNMSIYIIFWVLM